MVVGGRNMYSCKDVVIEYFTIFDLWHIASKGKMAASHCILMDRCGKILRPRSMTRVGPR